jgi:hypothetical protein
MLLALEMDTALAGLARLSQVDTAKVDGAGAADLGRKANGQSGSCYGNDRESALSCSPFLLLRVDRGNHASGFWYRV